MTVRIVMVDDHHMFREGMKTVLQAQTDLDVVGEGASADDARALAGEVLADVFLLDIALGGVDGITAARAVLDRAPRAKVLMLTMHSKPAVAIEALVAGASGLASKTQTAAELVGAIRTVAAGAVYLAPGLPEWVEDTARRRRFGGGDETGPIGQLTEREHEVFRLVVHGNLNEAIAAALSISGKTVESHRAHINRKLGAHSPADLVRFAAGHGLLFS